MSSSLSRANLNALWGTFAVETFYRLGLRYAVVSPGARSAPLTWALASHPGIEAIPVLDERSAGFFALGIARRTKLPVLLLATSGTAGAHYYPALIEASEANVPLLAVTADRPPELRDCGAGQTIKQGDLYGGFVRYATELPLPEPSAPLLRQLRQTLTHAWEIARGPIPGPVHLNAPFREPLAPVEDDSLRSWPESFDPDQLLPAPRPSPPIRPSRIRMASSEAKGLLDRWRGSERGLIVAGPAQPANPAEYCAMVGRLASSLGWPVLSDGLSPIRSHRENVPGLVTKYEFLLRAGNLRDDLKPDLLIQLGALPAGKTLRAWLEEAAPETWVITEGDRNLDPLHGRTCHVRGGVDDLVAEIDEDLAARQTNPYLDRWQTAENAAANHVARFMGEEQDLFEGKVAWLMSRHLPPQTPCFIAASMPVRDVEFYWEPGDCRFQIYCNRGVNGIDGTLSTAMGVCHDGPPGVLLTGDLACLHDANGLQNRPRFRGSLTVVLINNRGGGIFEKLPMARFDPPFEEFFATPQQVDFRKLAEAYGASYQKMDTWNDLVSRLNPLPQSGLRILEIPTDRKADMALRGKLFKDVADAMGVSLNASSVGASADDPESEE